jgi:hypothetical protein
MVEFEMILVSPINGDVHWFLFSRMKMSVDRKVICLVQIPIKHAGDRA